MLSRRPHETSTFVRRNRFLVLKNEIWRRPLRSLYSLWEPGNYWSIISEFLTREYLILTLLRLVGGFWLINLNTTLACAPAELVNKNNDSATTPPQNRIKVLLTKTASVELLNKNTISSIRHSRRAPWTLYRPYQKIFAEQRQSKTTHMKKITESQSTWLLQTNSTN